MLLRASGLTLGVIRVEPLVVAGIERTNKKLWGGGVPRLLDK